MRCIIVSGVKPGECSFFRDLHWCHCKLWNNHFNKDLLITNWISVTLDTFRQKLRCLCRLSVVRGVFNILQLESSTGLGWLSWRCFSSFSSSFIISVLQKDEQQKWNHHNSINTVQSMIQAAIRWAEETQIHGFRPSVSCIWSSVWIRENCCVWVKLQDSTVFLCRRRWHCSTKGHRVSSRAAQERNMWAVGYEMDMAVIYCDQQILLILEQTDSKEFTFHKISQNKTLTLWALCGHFWPFHFYFFCHFCCVNANGKKFPKGVYFTQIY